MLGTGGRGPRGEAVVFSCVPRPAGFPGVFAGCCGRCSGRCCERCCRRCSAGVHGCSRRAGQPQRWCLCSRVPRRPRRRRPVARELQRLCLGISRSGRGRGTSDLPTGPRALRQVLPVSRRDQSTLRRGALDNASRAAAHYSRRAERIAATGQPRHTSTPSTRHTYDGAP